jgi:hypothetical protein
MARCCAIRARILSAKLEGEPRIGDVVAFVMSVTVLVYALIDTAIGVFL